MKQPFRHEDFRFGYEIVLGSAYRGHADVGEVLSTAGRVEDGDADGWVREWSATAERLEADARRAEGDGRPVSARAAYLRAATYFSTGLYLITHSSAPGRQPELWKRHRACWDRFVDLAAVPGERPHLLHGPVRRVGGPGARLPRHDLRRPRPAGGPVPAAAPVPARLGGGADPGGGRDGGQAGRRPGPDRADRRQPGRLLGAARPRLRAPLRGRGRRPRRGRRVHLLAGAAARLHARPAPGPVQEGRLRQGDGLD